MPPIKANDSTSSTQIFNNQILIDNTKTKDMYNSVDYTDQCQFMPLESDTIKQYFDQAYNLQKSKWLRRLETILCNTIHFTKLLTSNIINKASKAAVNVSGRCRNIP